MAFPNTCLCSFCSVFLLCSYREEENMWISVCYCPHLEPACQAHRFPGLQDCPDELTMRPAGIAATCGFSIWKRSIKVKIFSLDQKEHKNESCMFAALFTASSVLGHCYWKNNNVRFFQPPSYVVYLNVDVYMNMVHKIWVSIWLH